MTFGLIGCGRFGALAARHLAREGTVFVFEPDARARVPVRRNIRRGTLAEAAAQPVVVLAVPVSALKATLRSILPHLRKYALVIDVCSVKSLPAAWMRSLLPPHVRCLGTHPLFGPDSAGRSVRGRRIVVCPVRIPRTLLSKIVTALRRKGLVPHVMSVEAHDRLAAQTILLTQSVGRLVYHAALPRHIAVTRSYASLLTMVDIASRDSLQLFSDMVRHNPEGRRVVLALQRGLSRVVKELS
jgi:prephenate dehydrogenase